MWGTTRGFEETAFGFEDCHAKIGDADVPVFVQQEVLGFKITMTSISFHHRKRNTRC